MTHSELTEAYRQALIAQRVALLAQIAQQRGGMRSRAEVAEEHFAHSEDSPAQVATERDLEFALNERETAELGQIAQAFMRLDQGTYGHCADCGAPIAVERLRVTPQACRCIACQEKAEHRPHSLHS
jgi:DnaK suppressor protein